MVGVQSGYGDVVMLRSEPGIAVVPTDACAECEECDARLCCRCVAVFYGNPKRLVCRACDGEGKGGNRAELLNIPVR